MEEEAFLKAVLAATRDDATLLVYADWLEEQGDAEAGAKCEFLRLQVEQVPSNIRRKRWLKQKRKRLQELAAKLDSEWLRVVSRMPVEHCQKGREAQQRIQWRFQCHKQWQDLTTTADRNVRMCEDCQQPVHFCDSIDDARTHAAAGRCVAVDLSVERREGDLLPPSFQRMTLGLVRPSYFSGDAEPRE